MEAAAYQRQGRGVSGAGESVAERMHGEDLYKRRRRNVTRKEHEEKMMKKKSSYILAACMLGAVLFTGCGSADENVRGESIPAVSEEKAGEQSQETAAVPEEEQGFVYTQGGMSLTVNTPMEQVVSLWEEPDKYFESQSCAFQGMDKVYTYGSVVINTYPEDGEDYVLSIELKDDTVATAEGCYIGSARDEVTAAYGTPDMQTDTAAVYEKGECQLSFFFEADYVSAITYTLVSAQS